MRFGGLTAFVAACVLMAGSVQAITFSLDAASAGLNGVAPDDLLFPGPGISLPGAFGLPPGPLTPPPVDVDAFTFTFPHVGPHSILGLEFSVAPGSLGVAGTAVAIESGGVGFADEPADIFSSALAGSNMQFADGDGFPPGPAIPLGLIEPGSNVDGYDSTPPFGLGIHYSITASEAMFHPVYSGTGSTGADIFFSPPVPGYSVMPALFAPGAALGLVTLDDIDALSIIEDGSGGPSPGDVIYFSLAPGSPTLGALGASPADILVSSIGGAPAVAVSAVSIGLLVGDDVDALDVFVIPEPASLAMMCLTGTLLLRRRLA